MKMITLWQPWASLIPLGLKQYETRSWGTSYRGPLLIHAAKRPIDGGAIAGWLHVQQVAEIKPKGKDDPFFTYLNLPLGEVVAIAQLTDCIKMTQEFIDTQSEIEIACGDWQVGRYAWKLNDVRSVEGILCKGMQGLIEAPLDVIKQVTTLLTPDSSYEGIKGSHSLEVIA
ncbi:MAG: ASCH domain-containing protein [Nostoc sp.]|uniref:ASCH domain-containing protein n=1 Tax=Nostoc sp. TaxID=1180 RepID=UPI002FF013A8